MNIYLLKPKGRYAVQWKGFNLTEISEMVVGSSASIDAESANLTLFSKDHKVGELYLGLRDWLLSPDGPGGYFEVMNDECFRRNYVIEKKVDSYREFKNDCATNTKDSPVSSAIESPANIYKPITTGTPLTFTPQAIGFAVHRDASKQPKSSELFDPLIPNLNLELPRHFSGDEYGIPKPIYRPGPDEIHDTIKPGEPFMWTERMTLSEAKEKYGNLFTWPQQAAHYPFTPAEAFHKEGNGGYVQGGKRMYP